MQNQLDTGERGVNVGTDLPVRIGDQPDDVDIGVAHSSSALPHRATSRCGTPR